MPIHPSFEQYKERGKSEENFTDKFIIPLLQRMGYSIVLNYHGQSEYGKDIVYAEFDRFGHVQFDAIQVKFCASIGKAKIQEAVGQGEDAFQMEFEHPETGKNYMIRNWKFANAGTVSDVAKKRILQPLTKKFGERVGVLDGKSLMNLSESTSYRQRELLGPLVFGLQIECMQNVGVVPSLKNRFKDSEYLSASRFQLIGLRHAALDEYLVRPFPIPGVRLIDLLNLSTQMRAVEKFFHHIDTGAIELDTGAIEQKTESYDSVANLLDELMRQIGVFMNGLNRISGELGLGTSFPNEISEKLTVS